jgi:hypothetical protein
MWLSKEERIEIILQAEAHGAHIDRFVNRDNFFSMYGEI